MNDPVIDELHGIKDELSREAGFDVRTLVEQMKKEIDRSAWNYVSFDKSDSTNQKIAETAS